MLEGKANSSHYGERIKADLILLAVAVVWGSSFVAGRVAAARLDAFLYNGLRFLLAVLALLPFLGRRLREMKLVELGGGALAGVWLFGAAATQQVGLGSTTAGKAGLITGLYVVLVPVFLGIVQLEWPHWSIWVASLLALVGLVLLSGVREMGLLTLTPGDVWVLFSAILWAFHVITVDWLVKRANAMRLALVQYAVCGALNLALVGPGEGHLLGVSAAWGAILYTGIFSIGLGFTLQVVGQQWAPPTDTAIILSAEAVFATLFGWLILNETLSIQQMLGCGLMLGAIVLAQLSTLLGEGDR